MLRTGRIKFLTITLPKIRIRPLRQMEHSNEWRNVNKMTIQENVRVLVYRYETSDKLDAIWSSLSEKARYEIVKNHMWFNDSLFERTPEEVNRFLEDEWSDDDDDNVERESRKAQTERTKL